jgi:uncharacterized membrane protein YgaE (UPF0421/DUF939 family)
MNEFIWVLIGICSALLIAFIVYLNQAYIKIYHHRKKIKNILMQIRGQVEVKHTLLKEYLEINKDLITDKKYKEISDKLNAYNLISASNIDSLKEFNDLYAYYMKSFNDNLLIKQCDESEEKINYIKDYYNELVCYYNRYKSSGFNSFLAKAMAIADEKLY